MQDIRRKGFLKRNWEFMDSMVSLLADLFLVNLSYFIAFHLFSGREGKVGDFSEFLIFINLMFLLLSLGLGIYRSRYNLSLKRLSLTYLELILFLAVLTMAFLFVIKKQDEYRHIVFITFILIFFLLMLTHVSLRSLQKFLIKKRFIGFKTIIIGTDEWAWKFVHQIRNAFGDFFQIQGYLHVKHGKETSSDPNVSDFVLGELEDLENIIHRFNPDIVYAVSETVDVAGLGEVVKICQRNSTKLKIVSPHFSAIFKHPKIRDVLGVSLVFDSWRIYYWRFTSRLKRFFDVLGVLLISPILIPVGLVIATAIKFTSKGPVFFKQHRVMYKGGSPFYCYKFRSMYTNAAELKENLLEKNESNGALFKMKKDPRVTPFGRIIRKLSLDELPQLINVLKGEMSIVGPRPLPVEDFERISNIPWGHRWQKHRGIVKPGLTGLWQILGRSSLSFEEMLLLDLYYIEHQSVFLDLEIIFSTFPTTLFGKGAY
jgi:exopolysaccharide biosynthesis polyprenyl glycosylphosphotransferase